MACADPIADVAMAHAVVPGLAFSAATSNDAAVLGRGDVAGCGATPAEQPPTRTSRRAPSSAVALGCLPRRGAGRALPFMAVQPSRSSNRGNDRGGRARNVSASLRARRIQPVYADSTSPVHRRSNRGRLPSPGHTRVLNPDSAIAPYIRVRGYVIWAASLSVFSSGRG